MSECHNCPVSSDIRAGKYKGVPWEQTPCADCKLSDEPKHKGKSHVYLESSGAVDNDESLRAHREKKSEQLKRERFDLLYPVFQDGLRLLLQLACDAPESFRIIAFRIVYSTEPLKTVATQLGITVQAAHSRLRRVLAKWPELQRVVPMQTYNRKESEDVSTARSIRSCARKKEARNRDRGNEGYTHYPAEESGQGVGTANKLENLRSQWRADDV